MRYLVPILLLLAGCGGDSYNGCDNPCPGAFAADLEYRCDGGLCPPGESIAQAWFECRCVNGHTLVFVQPSNEADCSTARANWTTFYSANCR